MKYGCSEMVRVVSGRTRRGVIAAVLLAMPLMLALAACGGGAVETPAGSLAQAAAPATVSTVAAETSSTAPVETTTTTLSLHDRVQQEQAQQEAQAKAQEGQASSTTAPAVKVFHVEPGKTLLLGDGGVVKPDEVEAMNDYVAFATDAQEEQQRLFGQYDALIQKAHDWAKADYSRFKSLISAEKSLLSKLKSVAVPPLYDEANRERARAAEVFCEAWQLIYAGDPGGTPMKSEADVNRGLQINLDGVGAWHSAENMTQSVTARVKNGVWR